MSPRLLAVVVESETVIVRVIDPVAVIVAVVALLGGLKVNVPSALVVTLTPPIATTAFGFGGMPVSARRTRPVTVTGVPPTGPPPPPPPPPQPVSIAATIVISAAA